MESNITPQQVWRPDAPLPEPHFNEEATLLAARRVVPIQELSVRSGYSRPWVVGFALAGSLLLGVSASALYYSRFRSTNGSQPALNIDAVSSGARGVASEAAAVNNLPTEATEVTSANGAVRSSRDLNTSARVKAGALSNSWTTRPLNAGDAVTRKPAQPHAAAPDDAAEPEDETSERRGAKRDARRGSDTEYETHEQRGARREERKRATRERRAAKHTDELLRIQEIFEGPPRP